jgi:hypothetical protein
MDVKNYLRTTLEGNVTETTYVQQMPAQAALSGRRLTVFAANSSHPVVVFHIILTH